MAGTDWTGNVGSSKAWQGRAGEEQRVEEWRGHVRCGKALQAKIKK